VSVKESYLSEAHLNKEISLIKEEISHLHIRERAWIPEMSSSALIVTDLQNYFLSPGSHAFIPSAPAIIPNIWLLIRRFRENNRPIIFTRHINDPDNAGSMKYWWNDLVTEGTSASLLYENLPSDKDIILTKHQYDAFQDTILEDILKSRQILYPVICGVMANLCCETTVRTAFVKGFRPVLPLDATASYNRNFHLSTFINLAFGFSPLLTTGEVIKLLLK
jgi:bifunctional isochorismate lyase / aryl carrier protein